MGTVNRLASAALVLLVGCSPTPKVNALRLVSWMMESWNYWIRINIRTRLRAV
jgi:hypothetical protein